MNAIDLLADKVADRIMERLGGLLDPAPELIDAAEVARRFGVSRDTVYAKADEWGAIRLGSGSKPRLRFDAEVVAEKLLARPDPVTTPARTRPKRRSADGGGLLPIRGES